MTLTTDELHAGVREALQMQQDHLELITTRLTTHGWPEAQEHVQDDHEPWAFEATDAEQRAYEDAPYARREAEAHGSATALDVVHELRYDYHHMMRAAQDPSRFDEGRIEPTAEGPTYHMTDEQYYIWAHSPETEDVVTLEIVAELQAHGYHEDAIILTPHGDYEQVSLVVPAHERTEDPELRRHLQESGRDVAQGVSATERAANSGEAVDREAYASRAYSPRRAAALEAAAERLPVREHPVYEQSRQALQEALADVLEEQAGWHPDTPEWYELHEEAQEIRATLARLEGREEIVEFVANDALPEPIDRYEHAQRQASRDGGLETLTSIEIDTSDPDLGQRWQDQLDALDARIAQLVGEAEQEESPSHASALEL
jgi:hypothetical protein